MHSQILDFRIYRARNGDHNRSPILLDEISPEVLVDLVPKLRALASSRDNLESSNQIVLEASGVDPKEIRTFAETGINLISTSAPMTRSTWIDFSMRFRTL